MCQLCCCANGLNQATLVIREDMDGQTRGQAGTQHLSGSEHLHRHGQSGGRCSFLQTRHHEFSYPGDELQQLSLRLLRTFHINGKKSNAKKQVIRAIKRKPISLQIVPYPDQGDLMTTRRSSSRIFCHEPFALWGFFAQSI